ncbi:hypothetical protein GCM10027569_62760 [Flindersiella endophytica]
MAAAWLEGSCGRGEPDALSDLDLAVVVADGELAAVADRRWVARLAEPLLLLEAPQNAPPGGAFLTSFFSGEAGPQQVDWLWLPRSTARRPRESLLLFDRAGVEFDAEAGEDGQPGAVPERTAYEVAVHAVPWFWATLLWNAKHAARHPGDDRLPMLSQTAGAVHDVERFLDPGTVQPAPEPVIERPADRLPVLADLADRMERLMARAPALTEGVSSAVPAQFRRYLQVLEQVGLGT